MSKHIRRILHHHVRSLATGMDTYQRAGQVKTMHAMRVDMKAIRSVFFLLEKMGSPQKAGKQHRRIKKIFAAAGKIREWQLEARWLRKHRKWALLRLLRYDMLIRQANQAFQDETRSHIRVLKEIRKSGDAMLREIGDKEIKVYLGDLLAAVLGALYSDLPMLDWHDLRKWIKRLLHGRLWMVASLPATPAVDRFCADMESLQASIGQWHDLQLLENRLHESGGLIRQHANARHEAMAAGRKLKKERAKLETQIRHLLTLMNKRWNNPPVGS